MECQLLLGDCLDRLKEIADNSIDSVVTDPPAGIAFMGKDWDKDKGGRDSWIAWMQAIASECLRVLKPGGHALVWGIPRTVHWTAMAWENAGFEMRDSIVHIFGSGFPKSLNLGKAIDKLQGNEREVVGSKLGMPGYSINDYPSDHVYGGGIGSPDKKRKTDITAPGGDDAKKWEGWGTGLKPAHENWLKLRKPLKAVPLSDILQETSYLLEVYLWSLLNAKSVEKVLKLSQAELNAEFSSARWLAAVWSIAGLPEKRQKMDIFKSLEMGSMFWSIALLWKGILAEALNPGNISTISMESRLITGLKTLNLFLLQITQDCTPHSAFFQSGLYCSALLAGEASKDADLNTQNTQKHTVAGNVMPAVLNTLADIAESLSLTTATQSGCIVPQNVLIEQTSQSAHENWLLLRKPIDKGLSIAANALKHGTGGINIDGCRVGIETISQHGRNANNNLAQVPQNEYKPENSWTGRYPANLIHDGSEEVLAIFPVTGKSSGKVDRSPSSSKPEFNFLQGSILPKRGAAHSDNGGSAARFFYCAKASKADRDEGLEAFGKQKGFDKCTSKQIQRRDPDTGVVTTHEYKPSERRNHHPTVKPTALMRYLCKLITPPNGIVLDPFMGSGSTGKAALLENFHFIGIERDAQYMEIARCRIVDSSQLTFE